MPVPLPLDEATVEGVLLLGTAIGSPTAVLGVLVDGVLGFLTRFDGLEGFRFFLGGSSLTDDGTFTSSAGSFAFSDSAGNFCSLLLPVFCESFWSSLGKLGETIGGAWGEVSAMRRGIGSRPSSAVSLFRRLKNSCIGAF